LRLKQVLLIESMHDLESRLKKYMLKEPSKPHLSSGKIVLLNFTDDGMNELICSELFRQGDLHIEVWQVMADDMQIIDSKKMNGSQVSLANIDKVLRQTSNSDLLVTIQTYHNQNILKSINQFAVSNNRRWVNLSIDNEGFRLGPSVIGNYLACYNCQTMVTMNSIEDILVDYRQGIENSRLVAMTAIIFLLEEIKRLISVNPTYEGPITYNQYMEYFASTSEIIKTKVIKMPKCRVCSDKFEKENE